MPRVAYPAGKYLSKQSQAIANSQILSDKEMSLRLGVSKRLYMMYKDGLVAMPPVLLYNKAAEDPDIATFAQSVKRAMWGL